LLTVQWLVEQYGTPLGSLQHWGRWLLRLACHDGHLEVAQWVVAFFGLTAANVHNDGAVSEACQAGHLRILAWLVVHFEFTRETISDYVLLQIASRNGDLAIVQWLISHFGPTVDDLRAASRRARECGRPAVVEWLEARFDLKSEPSSPT
jgi:hypothetical protein